MLLPLLESIYPNAKLFGQDLSTEMIRIAKSRAPKAILIEGDALNIAKDLEEARFDLITISYLLGYVDPNKLLPVVKKILQPAGSIFIATSLKSTLPVVVSLAKSVGIDLFNNGTEVYIPHLFDDFVDLGKKHNLNVSDARFIKKSVVFKDMGHFYDFAYNQGWGYQYIDQIGFGGKRDEFIHSFGHLTPNGFKEEIHLAFCLLTNS